MDIAISAVLFVIALLMAYMGIYMTLHPPSDQTKRRYKVGFLVLALASLPLVILQGVRSSHAAQRADEDQSRLERLVQEVRAQSSEIKRQNERVLNAIVSAESMSSTPTHGASPTSRPSVVATATPVVEGLRIVQREVPSKCDGAPYAVRATLQADRVLSAPTIEITASSAIDRWGMTPWPVYVAHNPRPNVLRVTLVSPALSPDTPLWVALCSKDPISITDVSMVH